VQVGIVVYHRTFSVPSIVTSGYARIPPVRLDSLLRRNEKARIGRPCRRRTEIRTEQRVPLLDVRLGRVEMLRRFGILQDPALVAVQVVLLVVAVRAAADLVQQLGTSDPTGTVGAIVPGPAVAVPPRP